MEGVDPDWIYTQASQRYVTYTHLDPGKYTFRVKGSNNDGLWNEEGTSITIKILPPWWQTWWFRSIMGVLIIGVLVRGYTKRISSLRKKHQVQKEFSHKLIDSQEMERKRVASELHDSHGQNLLILSNELQQYILNNKNSENELRPLLDRLNVSINEIRNISYDLHPHPIDKLGLKDALETLISRIENTIEIKFTLNIKNIDGLFSKKTEINLYRIIQEAINNIIKHSQATQARINIKRDSGTVSISISDNGIGFNQKKGQKKIDGLGLVSIKARAMLIGAHLTIVSKPGKGTIISLKNPFVSSRA
jgi:signal transduction histidine kinase